MEPPQASSRTLPYQCLVACETESPHDKEWTLFGATGPKLVVQSSTGSSSVWPKDKEDIKDDRQYEPEQPPGKKLKLSPTMEHAPNFSTLLLSNNRRYLVSVTAEDKCIRVFQINSGARLKQLSERCMPKRPSAIAITSDDTTILCGDKFGDVYALPLLWSPENVQNETPPQESSEDGGQKKFTPAASVLTVHSGRNRKVLEEQLKQAAKKTESKRDSVKFKHELILGHVSMLTGMVYTMVDSPTPGGKPRSYIITSDRDEHIRVSRGPAQGHIIEGFCQGHDAFVSKLCITQAGLLVSGGGDRELFVWDWLKAELLETVSIVNPVWDFLKENGFGSGLAEDSRRFNVAVSGIWNVPESKDDEILVACEGVPALFHFTIRGQRGSSGLTSVIPLQGNALGAAFIRLSDAAWTVVVSIDSMHQAGSMTERRDGEEEETSRLEYFSYSPGGQWNPESGLNERLHWFSKEAGQCENGQVEVPVHVVGDASVSGAAMEGARRRIDEQAAGVRDMMYAIEKLRKRPDAED